MRIFIMGENRWRDEQEFPLARTQYTPCYLHSNGAANSLHGDGALSFSAPGDEPVDTFLYDPRNPVPSRGGQVLGWDAAIPPQELMTSVKSKNAPMCWCIPPLRLIKTWK